jgi:hypothetical protein
MSVPKSLESIDGFDPLTAEDSTTDASIDAVLDDARKRVVYNFLKSYTGYYDIFSEMLQNSLDAVQQRQQKEGLKFQPRIWVNLDIPSGRVRVVDNGVGMSEREFKYCLRPSVSFKKQADLRGHKGVGATFLAYGFSFLKLQTKQARAEIAAILRQGRQWAEDNSGTVPRPKFEGAEFNIPELDSESSGTAAEIIIGQSPGERPRNLGWVGAQTAQQWYTVLRIKTPLGGVYLSTPPFKPKIQIRVRSSEKVDTIFETDRAEYFYPHEIPDLKVQSLHDITRALDSISGDSTTKFTKLQAEYKRLDCIYEVWNKDEILREGSYFASTLDDEKRLLIEKHNVIVYGCFLRSARMWGQLNDETFGLRKGQRIIQGGLQLATDFMVQGDLSIIPLTSTIGYQANSHVVVHFTDASPDLGRKVFQPELKDLAEDLSVRAVNTFKRFLQHLKPEMGPNTITPEKELHEWKRDQENHRDRSPLTFAHDGMRIAIVSTPQQEQDVIALFHELVGAGVLRGYRFFGTMQNDRYDSLFFMDYGGEDILFNASGKQRLGVNRAYKLPFLTEPKVLEYKYSFDSLVDDIENEEKFAKQIDLVVCWNAGSTYKSRFYLQSLLIADEGSGRQLFGATHHAFASGSREATFEVLILEDLLNWLQDPSTEEARQKFTYRDT